MSYMVFLLLYVGGLYCGAHVIACVLHVCIACMSCMSFFSYKTRAD